MVRKNALRVAAATLVLAGPLVASPAHADETGLFNTAAGNCGYGYRQLCAGHGQGVPIGLSSLTVSITCTAASPFVVNTTGVACYLVDNDDRIYLWTGPLFLPGNDATVTNVGTVPFQAYRLCVGGGYSTLSGEFRPVQNFVCR